MVSDRSCRSHRVRGQRGLVRRAQRDRVPLDARATRAREQTARARERPQPHARRQGRARARERLHRRPPALHSGAAAGRQQLVDLWLRLRLARGRGHERWRIPLRAPAGMAVKLLKNE